MTDGMGSLRLPISVVDLPEPMVVLAGRLLDPQQADAVGARPAGVPSDAVAILVDRTTIQWVPSEAAELVSFLALPRLWSDLAEWLRRRGSTEVALDELAASAPVWVCRPGPPAALAAQVGDIQLHPVVDPVEAPGDLGGVMLPVDARRGVHLPTGAAAAVFADGPLRESVPRAAEQLALPVERVWLEVFAAVLDLPTTGTGFVAIPGHRPAPRAAGGLR